MKIYFSLTIIINSYKNTPGLCLIVSNLFNMNFLNVNLTNYKDEFLDLCIK